MNCKYSLIQVKRLENLLNKCRETIKANKERTKQILSDRDSLAKQLQMKTEEAVSFIEIKTAVLAFHFHVFHLIIISQLYGSTTVVMANYGLH